MKKCPYCAEELEDDAIRCRYCDREYPSETTSNISIQREDLLVFFNGNLTVFIDGKEVGFLPQFETFLYPVTPGMHNIQIKYVTYQSKTFEFFVRKGKTVKVGCLFKHLQNGQTRRVFQDLFVMKDYFVLHEIPD